MSNLKGIETEVLRVFREEIPSIHFSDKTASEYANWTSDTATIYRELFHLPPELFEGKTLIDFGAGTGENTVHFAGWGANCTLVEMNPDALNIARNVFRQYATRGSHYFNNCSIFDYTDSRKYDFVYARGSL